MGKIVWWLQAAQSALRIDGLKKPFFAQVGDFPLYVAPPGSPNMGFGDLSYQPPSSGVGGFMEYFERAERSRARESHAGYWRWWTEQWQMNRRRRHRSASSTRPTCPRCPQPRPPTDLPPSKVFRGIGVASLHTTLTNSARGCASAVQVQPVREPEPRAQPAEQLSAQRLWRGAADHLRLSRLHGSKFHYQWCHSTRAHNAVLVDGQGQRSHSASSTGRILDFESVARDGLRRRQRRRGLWRPARAVSAAASPSSSPT